MSRVKCSKRIFYFRDGGGYDSTGPCSIIQKQNVRGAAAADTDTGRGEHGTASAGSARRRRTTYERPRLRLEGPAAPSSSSPGAGRGAVPCARAMAASNAAFCTWIACACASSRRIDSSNAGTTRSASRGSRKASEASSRTELRRVTVPEREGRGRPGRGVRAVEGPASGATTACEAPGVKSARTRCKNKTLTGALLLELAICGAPTPVASLAFGSALRALPALRVPNASRRLVVSNATIALQRVSTSGRVEAKKEAATYHTEERTDVRGALHADFGRALAAVFM